MAKAEVATWPSIKRVVVRFPRKAAGLVIASPSHPMVRRRLEAPTLLATRIATRSRETKARLEPAKSPPFRLFDLAGGEQHPVDAHDSDVRTSSGMCTSYDRICRDSCVVV